MCHNKVYKQLISKRKRDFIYIKVRKIEDMKHCNPKDFWKLFSKKKKTKSSDISLEDFQKYYSTLNENLGQTQNPTAEEFCADYDFDSTQCGFEELVKPKKCAEIESIKEK